MLLNAIKITASFLCIILLLNPLTAAAATAATGTITMIHGMDFGFDWELLTIHDGSTEFTFTFNNFGGDYSGYCVTTSTYEKTGQPCIGSEVVIVDTGGIGATSTMAERMVTAINTTTIGITAVQDVTQVDLTNDTTGTAGNVAMTETVAYPLFVVTGMSGGTDDAAAQVPEFSDFAYLSLFIFGGWYFYKRHEQHQQVA